MLTYVEIQRIIDLYDVYDLIEALDLKVEELIDAFDFKICECDEIMEKIDEYARGQAEED